MNSETSKPWLKRYDARIPSTIDADRYPALINMFEETFKKYKSQVAFDCMGKSLTFGELDNLSNHFAAYLIHIGMKPGDRIALMMPNMLQYPIALFGALRAGMIVVNTNPLYTPREMEHQFCDSGTTTIVIAENFASNLQKIVTNTPIRHVILTAIGDLLGFPKKQIVNFVVRSIKKMVPAYHIQNAVWFSETLKKGAEQPSVKHEGKPEDTILLQYTGGTTGVSKGAMLTNRNLIANMLQIRAIMMPFLVESKEIALSPLPMYHIFAFTVNCLALMGIGTRTVLITNAKDIPSVIKEFKKYPITVLTGVNTLFNALLNHSDFSSVNFKTLKITVGGGMAVQQSVAERWKQTTGCPLTEGYGMTETSPVSVCNPVDGTGKLGTIGLPVPSTDVRICNDNGEVLTTGEKGEIEVNGPQVMKGYYNKPEETVNVMHDDWLKTGDIGLIDEEGFVKIVDRKKDMILVSGFNVYPNEIEDVAALHTGIFESAAIGVPDEKSGEVVKLFVVLKDETLTKENIIEHCKKHLTGYKVPKFVEFRKELPKSNVGKILRRELKV